VLRGGLLAHLGGFQLLQHVAALRVQRGTRLATVTDRPAQRNSSVVPSNGTLIGSSHSPVAGSSTGNGSRPATMWSIADFTQMDCSG